MANTNDRQDKFKQKQSELGRSQKIFWLTNDEWIKAKDFIKYVLRNEKPCS